MSLVATEIQTGALRAHGTLESRRLAPASLEQVSGEAIGNLPSSAGFSAMLSAYRSSGGTARGDDLARLLKEHRIGDFVSLAKLIASNAVFAFEWRSTLWVPMFQFELGDLSAKVEPRMVAQELGKGFDGWARAAWFVTRNSWLTERRPVDVLGSDLPSVMSAARTDRFIAVG